MPTVTKVTPPPPLAPAVEVLTLSEAATLLRVSSDGLKADAEAGRVPGRVVAGEWRFSRVGLLDWLSRSDSRAVTTSGAALVEHIRRTGVPWTSEAEREAEEFIAAVSGLRKTGSVGT